MFMSLFLHFDLVRRSASRRLLTQSTRPPQGGTLKRLTSIQRSSCLCSFGLFDLLGSRLPDENFKVTASAGRELHPFSFEHSLLLVGRQYQAARRATSLGIDYPMPRSVFLVRAVHYETHRARRISFAQDDGNLPIGHHPAARNPTHNFVDALAILRVSLWLFLHYLAIVR